MLTAGSISASFLGTQGLGGTKVLAGTAAPVADKTLQPLEVVGMAAFALLVLIRIDGLDAEIPGFEPPDPEATGVMVPAEVGEDQFADQPLANEVPD